MGPFVSLAFGSSFFLSSESPPSFANIISTLNFQNLDVLENTCLWCCKTSLSTGAGFLPKLCVPVYERWEPMWFQPEATLFTHLQECSCETRREQMDTYHDA